MPPQMLHNTSFRLKENIQLRGFPLKGKTEELSGWQMRWHIDLSFNLLITVTKNNNRFAECVRKAEPVRVVFEGESRPGARARARVCVVSANMRRDLNEQTVWSPQRLLYSPV